MNQTERKPKGWRYAIPILGRILYRRDLRVSLERDARVLIRSLFPTEQEKREGPNALYWLMREASIRHEAEEKFWMENYPQLLADVVDEVLEHRQVSRDLVTQLEEAGVFHQSCIPGLEFGAMFALERDGEYCKVNLGFNQNRTLIRAEAYLPARQFKHLVAWTAESGDRPWV